MGRRDYEMEDAVKAVEGQVAEPIVREQPDLLD